ncbi:hypothetical protein BDE02_12G028800 [Populus trichocarpa]|nr:hypothetical protein BDE02_12G028800 [Populus trichocarpa]
MRFSSSSFYFFCLVCEWCFLSFSMILLLCLSPFLFCVFFNTRHSLPLSSSTLYAIHRENSSFSSFFLFFFLQMKQKYFD